MNIESHMANLEGWKKLLSKKSLYENQDEYLYIDMIDAIIFILNQSKKQENNNVSAN